MTVEINETYMGAFYELYIELVKLSMLFYYHE